VTGSYAGVGKTRIARSSATAHASASENRAGESEFHMRRFCRTCNFVARYLNQCPMSGCLVILTQKGPAKRRAFLICSAVILPNNRTGNQTNRVKWRNPVKSDLLDGASSKSTRGQSIARWTRHQSLEGVRCGHTTPPASLWRLSDLLLAGAIFCSPLSVAIMSDTDLS
jgi:hypothetical protein